MERSGSPPENRKLSELGEFGLIARLRGEGLSVLLVEQNVVESLALAHRAYILEQGRFALSGSAAEIAADPRLKRAYLGM